MIHNENHMIQFSTRFDWSGTTPWLWVDQITACVCVCIRYVCCRCAYSALPTRFLPNLVVIPFFLVSQRWSNLPFPNVAHRCCRSPHQRPEQRTKRTERKTNVWTLKLKNNGRSMIWGHAFYFSRAMCPIFATFIIALKRFFYPWLRKAVVVWWSCRKFTSN